MSKFEDEGEVEDELSSLGGESTYWFELEELSTDGEGDYESLS